MAKRALGRGLSALIPGLSAGERETELRELRLEEIHPNPRQPRKSFDREAIAELVSSIREFGVVQPVVVRSKDGKYELVAGERRWRAAKEAGLESIRAILVDVGDRDAIQIALIENLQREDLNAVEEAEAYQQLINEYGMTQAELASHLGRSRSAISNTLRLLSLPQEIRQAIIDGHISSGHARSLLSVQDERTQLRLAKQIRDERLSVRDIEDMVREKRTESGEEEVPRQAPARPPAVMRELAKELTRHIGTRVSILPRGEGGQIRIAFMSLQELALLVKVLQRAGEGLHGAPQVPSRDAPVLQPEPVGG